MTNILKPLPFFFLFIDREKVDIVHRLPPSQPCCRIKAPIALINGAIGDFVGHADFADLADDFGRNAKSLTQCFFKTMIG